MTIPLTQPDPTLGEQIAKTPPGMAHWAGTGPEGATCRKCVHWHRLSRPYEAFATTLKPARCNLYVKLMRGADPNARPNFRLKPSQAACRHFERHPHPLPVRRATPKARP